MADENIIFESKGYQSKFLFKSLGGFLIGISMLGLLISIVAVQQIKDEINFIQYIIVVGIIVGLVIALGIFLIVYSYLPSKEADKVHLTLMENNFTFYYKKSCIELKYEQLERIKYDMQDPSRVSKYHYSFGDLRIWTKDDKYYAVKCLDAQNAKKHIDNILAKKGIVIDSRIDY